MKTATQLRAHVLDAIPDLIGTRTYGNISEPAISVIPDPQFSEGGMNFPSVVNGDPVIYQGIEVVIYDGYENNEYTAMLNNEARLDRLISILIKDWDTNDNANITMAALLISKGLYIVNTLTPPQVDKAPLLKSIILIVGYAGYL